VLYGLVHFARSASRIPRAAPLRHLQSKLSRNFSQSFDGEAATLFQIFFHNGAPAWAETVSAVRRVNASPSTIIDIASGPGEPACSLSEAFPTSSVICSDSSPDMVEMARTRSEQLGRSNMTFSVDDMNDLSTYGDGTKDIVTAQFGLMFSPDLPIALSEIHRVLKPEGHLVATVWQEFDLFPLVKETMTEILGKPPPAPPLNPMSLADPDPLDAALAAAGFEIAEGHREAKDITFNMGPSTNEKAYKACLIPVLPKLKEMQEESEENEDFIAKALGILKTVAAKQISKQGDLQLSGVYRYVVVKKPGN